MHGQGFIWDDHEPTTDEIKALNEKMLEKHRLFGIAAEYVASGLSQNSSVRRIELFGSIAVPLKMEMPKADRYRKLAIQLYHECRDIDFAVWIHELKNLRLLQKQIAGGLDDLKKEKGISVAHHQVDIYILNHASDEYLGRLCIFNSCPRKKYVCRIPGCGNTPFLQMHQGFTFDRELFRKQEKLLLFERGGTLSF